MRVPRAVVNRNVFINSKGLQCNLLQVNSPLLVSCIEHWYLRRIRPAMQEIKERCSVLISLYVLTSEQLVQSMSAPLHGTET